MLAKEEGYDEFLAEKIRLGREDIKAGRVVSLEEAKAQIQQALLEKINQIRTSKPNRNTYE